jgi:hypothetical protein
VDFSHFLCPHLRVEVSVGGGNARQLRAIPTTVVFRLKNRAWTIWAIKDEVRIQKIQEPEELQILSTKTQVSG